MALLAEKMVRGSGFSLHLFELNQLIRGEVLSAGRACAPIR
ncbi:MAG: hypothetical protein AAF542_11060 [Pseudomonadota bacterium]